MNQLSLAGTTLEYFHVCAFFNSKEEEYDVLVPFFKQGLDQGEKNMHIVDAAYADEHKSRLTSAGIDAQACMACGQLEVVSWREAYLDDNGVFDKDRMLATVDHLTGAGRDAGYKRLRIMGNMDWVFKNLPGADKVIEYEAEVNEVLSRNQQPAVCVYDTAKLSGGMMMDLLRTHPLTLVGGVVQENPFYITPAKMVQELRTRSFAEQHN